MSDDGGLREWACEHGRHPTVWEYRRARGDAEASWFRVCTVPGCGYVQQERRQGGDRRKADRRENNRRKEVGGRRAEDRFTSNPHEAVTAVVPTTVAGRRKK